MSVNPIETKELWQFGPFRLDGRARLLFRDGVPVSLTPKALEVLFYLARNSGRAVTRQELLDSIWPETVVTDASLTQAVFLIRKALGEPELPRLLETVPRVGYRLNLLVELPGGSLRAVQETSPSSPVEAGETPSQESELPEATIREAVVPGQGLVAGEAVATPASTQLPTRSFLIPIAIALVLLVAGTIPFVRDARKRPVSTAPAGLLKMEREIAVPPDTLRVLGVIDKTIVLMAPSAFYLLPADGALAASRVPLAEGEVAVWPLVADRLWTIRGRKVSFRNPAGPERGEIGELPPGSAVALEGRPLASRSGRFLALRDERALEVFERSGNSWVRRLKVDLPHIEGEVMAVSERFVALAQGRGNPVRAWSLPAGETVLEAPFAERQVFALAVDDARGAVAAGGPFDSVAVFPTVKGAPVRLLPVRGWSYGLVWVPDSPTLLVSGLMGLRAFRESSGVVADLPQLGGAGPAFLDSDYLAVLLPRTQRLALVKYAGIVPTARVATGGRALWAIEGDAAGKKVFAGGRDGYLWVVDTSSLAVRREEAHTDGIPSLVRDGDLLASSSDDKTVGVWKLPGPALVHRTRAHEFLVNDLTIATSPEGKELVTSSSDGTVKRWTWPGLVERETIDVQKLLGRPVSFHAVWSAPGVTRILAGTWNSSLLDLSKEGDSWRLAKHPVSSRAIYRLAALPRLGLVVAVGILPSEVHVFDLHSGTLQKIDDAGMDAMWVAGVPEADEVIVAGLDGVLRYTFSRTGPSQFRYSMWAGRETGAGLQTAILLPGGVFWAGTTSGELLRYDLARLEGAPLVSRNLEFTPSRP